jgi:acylphosphatase
MDICLRIVVEGRVQGVGYRKFVNFHANELGLGGYVMNQSDGTVLVRVCGTQGKCDLLLESLYQGPPIAKVKKIHIEEIPMENFSGFVIRR